MKRQISQAHGEPQGVSSAKNRAQTARKLGETTPAKEALHTDSLRPGADIPGFAQAKLAIGSSSDPLEKEADDAADKVLSKRTPSTIAPAAPSIRRRATPSATEHRSAPPSVMRTLSSQSSPMDASLRKDMENRFSWDFSQVRVHTGGVAERSASEINARAYTVGNHIVFGSGAYSSATPTGRRLIAHELAHVIQQSGGRSATGGAPYGGFVQRQVFMPPPQAGGFQRGFDQDKNYLLHPDPEETERRRAAIAREKAFEDALKPFKDALLGEFEEDPSTAGMALDTVLGLIPIVDQGLDIRDIIAHIYMMSEGKQYDKPMRWVGLALTLIGVVPEIGSAVKGVAKILIKKGKKGLDLLAGLLEIVLKVRTNVPDMVRKFRKLMSAHWGSWVGRGKSVFESCMKRVERLLDAAGALGKEKLKMVRKVRELAAQKLDEAFEKLRREMEEAMDAISPEPALAGGPSRIPDAPSKPKPLQTSGSGAGAPDPRKATKKEIDEAVDVIDSPAKKGQKRPRLEDPSHPKGSRSVSSRAAGEELPRRMDLEDLPRKAGETSRDALVRISRVAGQNLKDLPGLVSAWNSAKKTVLKTVPAPKNAKEAREVFGKIREEFWESVKNNKTLKKYFDDSGFEFPAGKGRAPQLADVDPSIPDAEKIVSLDHIKNLGEDWNKALDPTNLKMEFSGPNTMREIKKMRHPELR